MSWSGSGRRPAVVLLHGQPGSSADWELVQAELVRAELVQTELSGLQLLVPDRPGYDGTPAGGFGLNAAAVLRLLDAAGVDRAVLVGHSWGGGVALQTALQAPERVAALCLLGSVGSPDAVTRTDRLLTLPAVGRANALFMKIAGQRMAPALAASSGSQLDPDQLRRLGASLAAWSRTDAWRSFTVEQRAFVREAPALAARLSEVRAPAVVVLGRRDSTISPDQQRDLAARLPHAELIELECGHLLPLEAPVQVAAAIERAVALAALER